MRIVEVTARRGPDIPLVEVSGLALARDQGGAFVLSVGDRAAEVAWAPAEPGADGLAWRVEQLPGDVLGRDGRPQLEAVAADGAGGVLLVQEWPNRAILADMRTRSVRAVLSLEVPPGAAPSALASSWQDPRSSHAEGALLLRDGHLLVVKEKDPSAVLEFGPPGAAPHGFTADRRLADGQAWQPPAGPSLHLLAAWLPDADLGRVCRDLSDAAEAPVGSVLLLSDQGRSIAQLPGCAPADDPLAGVLTASVVWRVRGLAGKPEGLVVLPDGECLVGCDRQGSGRNLFVVRLS